MRPTYLAAIAAFILLFAPAAEAKIHIHFHKAKSETHVAAKVENRNNGFATKIASAAACVARKLNSVGYCYKAICEGLHPLGIDLCGQSAYMAKDQLKTNSRFKVIAVNKFDNLKPGDIIVHGKSATHPDGHIAVYLGSNQEASDHIQALVTSAAYGTTVVFRPQG